MAVKVPTYTQQTSTPRGGIDGGNPMVVQGPDLGGALMDLAAGIGNVQRHRERERKEQEDSIAAAYAANFLAETQSEAARVLTDLQMNSDEAGTGVVEGINSWMTERMKLAKPPNDTAARFLQTQLLEYKTKLDIGAYDFETTRRRDWALNTHDRAITSAAQVAASDMEMAPTVIAQQRAAIEGNSMLDPVTKQEKIAELIERVSYAAVLGERERDPYLARSKLLRVLGLNASATAPEIVLERDSAILALSEIQEKSGVTIPPEMQQEAVTALMSGGGVAVDNTTGEIKVTRGQQWTENRERAGFAYDALPIPRVVELLSGAEAEIARRENAAASAAEQGKALILQRVADVETALTNGEAVPLPAMSELIFAQGEGRAAVTMSKLMVLQANAGELAGMAGKTNEELDAVVNAAPTGTGDREIRQAAYGLKVRAAASERAARDADPGGYVLQKSPSVRAAYDAFVTAAAEETSIQADPEAAALVQRAQTDYIRASMTEQRRLGIHEPKMPKAFLEDVTRQFNEGMATRDSETAARRLEGAAMYMRDAPEALQQLGESVGEMGRLAIDGVPGPVIRRLMEQAKVKDADRSAILATRGVVPADIDTAVAQEFAPLVASFGAASDSDTARRYLDAGKALSVDILASGRAGNAQEAARMAYTELYAERNAVAGGLRIPNQYVPEKVVSGLETYLRVDVRDRVAITPEPGFSEAETRARTARTLQQYGRWITNANGDGAFLYYGGKPVQAIDGSDIEVKYEDASVMQPPVPVADDLRQQMRRGVK